MTESLRKGRDGPTMPEGKGYRMVGEGSTDVPVSPEELWRIVMDEERLAAAIPGAETLRRVDDGTNRTYAADVSIGVGRLKGVYVVTAEFAETNPPRDMVLLGGADGPFGRSSGEGWVDFCASETGTTVRYSYAILITGIVAKAGGRLLDLAAKTLIDKFFSRLARAVQAQEVDP